MLLKKLTTAAVILAFVMAVAAVLGACSGHGKGGIVILEDVRGDGFTMEFKEWSAKNKCELSLNSGDMLQMEMFREDGEFSMTVSGKKGSEPYAGKDLQSGLFTITVSESDEYVFAITGEDATGSFKCNKL